MLDALEAREERYNFFKNKKEEELYYLAVYSWCDCALSNIDKLKYSDISDKNMRIQGIRRKVIANWKKLLLSRKVSFKSKCSIGIHLISAKIWKKLSKRN